MTPLPAPSSRSERLPAAAVAVALVAAFVMLLTNLDHTGIKGLDESFHAVVAANLLDSPLKPELYRAPRIATPVENWMAGGIWLHKPTLPLWQIAGSYALFGVNTFALRLPSLLLFCGACAMTYLTGRRLVGPVVAAPVAVAQAFLPSFWMLVHGYAFSDHIDIALLFWLQLSVFLLVRAAQTGRQTDAVLCGVAQGLAWLSKSHPALIVTGLAALLWAIPKFRPAWSNPPHGEAAGPAGDARARLGGRQFVFFLLSTLATILPWTLYCAIVYPEAFAQSQLHVLKHLSTDVEAFAGPWDRVLFDYQPQLMQYFFPIGLAAAVISARAALRERSVLLLLPLAWWVGFVVPHVLAVSKTPSQTAPAGPAMLLMIAIALRETLRRDVFALVTMLAAAGLAVAWQPVMKTGGFGYPKDYTFGQIMRGSLWTLIQPAIAMSLGLLTTIALRQRDITRRVAFGAAGLIGVCVLVLTVQNARICRRVTAINDIGPTYLEVGPFVQTRFSSDAVLLIEEKRKLETNTAMFYCRRNAYAVNDKTVAAVAAGVRESGGTPYLLTDRVLPLRLIFDSKADGRFIYVLP